MASSDPQKAFLQGMPAAEYIAKWPDKTLGVRSGP